MLVLRVRKGIKAIKGLAVVPDLRGIRVKLVSKVILAPKAKLALRVLWGLRAEQARRVRKAKEIRVRKAKEIRVRRVRKAKARLAARVTSDPKDRKAVLAIRAIKAKSASKVLLDPRDRKAVLVIKDRKGLLAERVTLARKARKGISGQRVELDLKVV